MKPISILLLWMWSFSPGAGAQDSARTQAGIVIINAFDAMGMEGRKNKKELFGELAENLKQHLADEIIRRAPEKGAPVILPGTMPEAQGSDSIVLALMKEKGAAVAIVIKEVKVYFNQTHVEVVKEEKSKTRTAFYDICSDIRYAVYKSEKKHTDDPVSQCEFFTKRNVISGMLAAGPDIVGKSKHARKAVVQNAEIFTRRNLADLTSH